MLGPDNVWISGGDTKVQPQVTVAAKSGVRRPRFGRPYSYPRDQSVTQRRSYIIRTARRITVVLLPTFAALHVLPNGPKALAFSLVTSGALALVLVAVNIFSKSYADEEDPARLLMLHRIELAADSLVVVLASWLLLSQPESGGWFILVLPLLEGAMRLDRRGAFVAGGFVVAAHMVGLLAGAALYDDVHTPSLSVLITRAAALVVAGFIAMAFAEEFERESEFALRARADQEQRSAMLEIVLRASSEMKELEVEHTTQVMMEAVYELGFRGIAIATEVDTGWDIDELSPMFEAGDGGVRLAKVVATLTALSREAIYLSEEILDVQLHDQFALAGDVAGIPIYRGGPMHCVLVVSHQRIGHFEIEMAEVLAAQASTVLDHVRMFNEAEELRDQLSHRAFHDELTGLPNRAEFTRQLERRMTRGESEDDGVAVLFLDLDGFKDVNDAHGHAAGDILLGAVAGRLRNCVRPDDHVARLGGDEFTVLLTRTDSSDSARSVARRIQDVLARPYNVNGQECHIDSSIGVAFSEDVSVDPLTLLKRADAAMYQAKRGGKAQVRVDDGSHLQLELETWIQ